MRYFTVILFLALCCSCKKADLKPIELTPFDHTLIVVMEANNNLKSFALDNINEMELAAQHIGNAAVVVYLRSQDQESVLLKIKYDSNRKVIASDTLKKYQVINSSPEQIKTIIADAQEFCPATSYGLILWSHATSWAPPVSKGVQLFSFGEDQGKQMDIMELSRAIPTGFHYLIFDACNMASLEVLWEFKDKATYILASPTEVLATGFPYGQILPHLTDKNPDLKQVANQYFEYYNALQGQMQSASISLIDTKELRQLSDLCAKLYTTHQSLGIPTRAHVQRLDYTDDFPVPSFDFVHYLETNFPESSLVSIKNQLEKIVLYKKATTYFLGNPIVSFSGLSCYIPDQHDLYLDYYRTLNWYHDSKSNVLF